MPSSFIGSPLFLLSVFWNHGLVNSRDPLDHNRIVIEIKGDLDPSRRRRGVGHRSNAAKDDQREKRCDERAFLFHAPPLIARKPMPWRVTAAGRDSIPHRGRAAGL